MHPDKSKYLVEKVYQNYQLHEFYSVHLCIDCVCLLQLEVVLFTLHLHDL